MADRWFLHVNEDSGIPIQTDWFMENSVIKSATKISKPKSGTSQEISCMMSDITLTMPKFLNGLIHLIFLALSIIILGIPGENLKVGQPTV